MFDKAALSEVKAGTRYVSHNREVIGETNRNATGSDEQITPGKMVAANIQGTYLEELEGTVINPEYADQIPPFNITLSATNEMGNASYMRVLGVEILNEGSGVSVDDMVLESQMTFVCRKIVNWKQVEGSHIDVKKLAPEESGSGTGGIAV